MAVINPQKIDGSWLSGVALDVHTTGSTYVGVDQFGHDRFESTRSEVGELLYRLKYKADLKAAQELIETTAAFLAPHRSKFDLIIPVPPSAKRAMQPVIEVARGIGTALGIPVIDCVKTNRETSQLKGVTDLQERQSLLAGLHTVDPAHTQNKNILLFDDLFRSGSTLNAVTDILLAEGKAAAVRVLTLTRTRSNR